MVEFTMSAHVVFADGSRANSELAEIRATEPGRCFAAMGEAVARWMPPGRHARRGVLPAAIELQFGWNGEEQAVIAMVIPHCPREGGEMRSARESGALAEVDCGARRCDERGGGAGSPGPEALLRAA